MIVDLLVRAAGEARESIAPGDRVVIHGLHKTPQHNGKTAVALRFFTGTGPPLSSGSCGLASAVCALVVGRLSGVVPELEAHARSIACDACSTFYLAARLLIFSGWPAAD